MSKQWTVAQKEKRAAMSQLLSLMKGDILDAYRRGIEYGEEPPVVELRIADDFDRDQGRGLTVKTINPSELSRIGSMARKLPEILDVPQDHFRVIATDDTDDLLAIITLPIPNPTETHVISP